ncbi:unnamed protein product [Blepharisma stoltei]|uniref:Uncharacterized protein n=1 Tax=Blepharisma stoltei TaxID=1481888 RepID=A0AAU9KFE5_9CILI|nr:unnamed protein product [Blepharisma stoltei]
MQNHIHEALSLLRSHLCCYQSNINDEEMEFSSTEPKMHMRTTQRTRSYKSVYYSPEDLKSTRGSHRNSEDEAGFSKTGQIILERIE